MTKNNELHRATVVWKWGVQYLWILRSVFKSYDPKLWTSSVSYLLPFPCFLRRLQWNLVHCKWWTTWSTILREFEGNWLHTVWFHMKSAWLWRITLKKFLCILKPNTPLASKLLTTLSRDLKQPLAIKSRSLSMAREETTKRSPRRTDEQWRRLIVEHSLVDRVEKGDCLQSNPVPATPVLVVAVTKICLLFNPCNKSFVAQAYSATIGSFKHTERKNWPVSSNLDLPTRLTTQRYFGYERNKLQSTQKGIWDMAAWTTFLLEHAQKSKFRGGLPF